MTAGRAGMADQPAMRAPIGPGSLLWHFASDTRSMFPGLSLGLLQLMHPAIGAAVTEHSAFSEQPFERVYRSVPQIWSALLLPDGDARSLRIRDLHSNIAGTDERQRRYHALEPETFWWAHACFTWGIFRSVELFHARQLDDYERARLYAETLSWYDRYGVSSRPVPPDYAAFRAKFDHVCADVLEWTPAVRQALHVRPAAAAAVSSGASPLAGRFLNLVTPDLGLFSIGCMPPIVRRRFDLRLDDDRQRRFDRSASVIRQGARLVPDRLNYSVLRTFLRQTGAHTRADRYQAE
ncbi:oxygenase MpaB family protein [Nocardia sp. NBC_01503]|uniref:oxygenase MpaB family protein n=1 Tax=Nocardia sp. NBC_01503 TaxID=2975997 RepID=UPI002E7AC0D7|nr:oxygenase MpaB family protein [Nocardia sp. NBC_01503]WTL32150.1 oxygenase MpaB family protein [Nocardia sp. NBC_01503]